MRRREAVVLLLIALGTRAASAQDAAPVVLEPAGRFGCAACTGPQLFGRIAALAWLDDERILVLDGEAPFVRIFSADGRPLAAFANEGAGPGELRIPIAAAPAGPDAIEVLDIRLLRVTRFSVTGAVTGTRALPRSAFPLGGMRRDGHAEWILRTTDFRMPTFEVRRLADGADSTELLLASDPAFPRDRNGQPAATAAFAVHADGSFVIGEGAFAYRIRRFTAAGEPAGEIVRDIERPRRTPAELRIEQARRDREADRIRAMRAAEGGGPGPLPPIPETRNHFDTDALRFDERGRLWVRTTRGGLDRTVFDLFAADGAWLGQAAVAGAVRAWALGPGGLVGAVEDTDGVPQVVRWRVRWR